MSAVDSAWPSASARRLGERMASLPSALSEALGVLDQTAMPIAPLSSVDAPICVTGGGMSEGPARFLVALLVERGTQAEYVPLSEFVGSAADPDAAYDAPSKRHGTLVIFSQGLAPNARFPLLHAQRFRRCLLVTAVDPAAANVGREKQRLTARLAASAQSRGVQVLTLPPADEEGLLLRVVGPAVHALAAAFLAGFAPALLRQIPAVYQANQASVLPPCMSLRTDGDLPPVALIASGRYANACFGLRWKLLEGLQLPDPPIWDLLQVAHGPLQSIWTRSQTLLVLQRAAAPHEAPLQGALAAVFCSPRHRIVTLPASHLPGLLAYFEHDAQLNRLVLDGLEHRAALRPGDPAPCPAIDLMDWPGRGHDGPLYDLAPAVDDLIHLEHVSAPQTNEASSLRAEPESQGAG